MRAFEEHVQATVFAGLSQSNNYRLVLAYRKEPVRFDSFRFRTCQQFICSVRFGSENIVQSDSACVFGRVVARSGSVRLGSAGCVRFLIPSCLFVVYVCLSVSRMISNLVMTCMLRCCLAVLQAHNISTQ